MNKEDLYISKALLAALEEKLAIKDSDLKQEAWDRAVLAGKRELLAYIKNYER